MASIQLPSGAKVEAIAGYVGMNDRLEVASGYDDGVFLEDPSAYGRPLSPAQQVELADVMLDRWRRFRERAAESAATTG